MHTEYAACPLQWILRTYTSCLAPATLHDKLEADNSTVERTRNHSQVYTTQLPTTRASNPYDHDRLTLLLRHAALHARELRPQSNDARHLSPCYALPPSAHPSPCRLGSTQPQQLQSTLPSSQQPQPDHRKKTEATRSSATAISPRQALSTSS